MPDVKHYLVFRETVAVLPPGGVESGGRWNQQFYPSGHPLQGQPMVTQHVSGPSRYMEYVPVTAVMAETAEDAVGIVADSLQVIGNFFAIEGMPVGINLRASRRKFRELDSGEGDS